MRHLGEQSTRGIELSSKSTFIVADDHPLFREALIHAIGNCVDDSRIVEADSLDTLQNVVEEHPEADLRILCAGLDPQQSRVPANGDRLCIG